MNTPAYRDHTLTVYLGDCLHILPELPDGSVDSVVTDPPYGLEFMGKEWDAPWKQGADVHAEARTQRADENKRRFIASAVNKYAAGLPFQQWCQLWAAECLRILKPGGHLLAFGGTRTWHRLACAVEDAGFEIRDSIAWLYGSGFPKSLDVSKAIDKAAGATRDIVGTKIGQPGYSLAPSTGGNLYEGSFGGTGDPEREAQITAPATVAAQQWAGWGTALKPAHEPIVVARKPLTGTVAANVLTYGTGALNIDGCRIEGTGAQEGRTRHGGGIPGNGSSYELPDSNGAQPAGRWPANVALDESQAAALDTMSGDRPSSGGAAFEEGGYGGTVGLNRNDRREIGYGDQGGASRFFYVAKADQAERIRLDGTAHPTVKPLALMRWLTRLITPPGGTILEPFAGSGTTVEAAILEGFHCIAIEREPDYLPVIIQRINRRRDPVAAIKAAHQDDPGLFALLDEPDP